MLDSVRAIVHRGTVILSGVGRQACGQTRVIRLSGREATLHVSSSFVDGGYGSKRDPLGSWVVPLGFVTLEMNQGPATAGVERPETQCGGSR